MKLSVAQGRPAPFQPHFLVQQSANRETIPNWTDHASDVDADGAGDEREKIAITSLALYEASLEALTYEGSIHAESVLGLLSALGGFACAVAACDAVGLRRGPQAAGEFHLVTRSDGRTYIFGDLPNMFLLDDPLSLVRLALDEIRSCGGEATTEMIGITLRHVAQTSATAEFGIPSLAEQHAPADLPLNYVTTLWPVFEGILQRGGVPVSGYPAALGYALQQAIRQSRDVIQPETATQIVLECAIPMAQVFPGTLSMTTGFKLALRAGR